MKKTITVVDHEQIDRRIDNYLLSKIKGVPKGLLQRLLRQGHVRVNKKRIKSGYRVQLKDEITLPELRESSDHRNGERPPKVSLIQLLRSRILFEDDDLLIINKPSGLPVHGGSRISNGLIEVLRIMRSEAKFLELVHRLDKETSGCLIIAKKRSVLKSLHELLREHRIKKIYQALTLGHWKKRKTQVQLSLKKNSLRSGERKVVVTDEGKEALSEFQVFKKFDGSELVQVKIETGRTHQIRVHAAQSGHPIAGDEKYGDRAFNNLMRAKGLKRLFLHAMQISFTLNGERYVVKAPLDEDLAKVLEK